MSEKKRAALTPQSAMTDDRKVGGFDGEKRGRRVSEEVPELGL